ncbi:MAG TPA: sulfatase-like hydrolase/transferase [Candidatus Polarisedimenticolia bacterium]|jgi:hypothetical protein|nr:sulfatase-like hydrolase/transferase [Candidatus Polarisedimenticolia bacterium]
MTGARDDRPPAETPAPDAFGLRRILPPLVTVFLLFTPFLSALGSERNRYFLFWGRRDTVALVASIALLSAIAIVLSAAIDRLGNPVLQWLRDVTFLSCLGLGILANALPLLHLNVLLSLARQHREAAGLLLNVASGLVAIGGVVAFMFARRRLVETARGLTLILSPLVLLVLGPALFWRSWDFPPDPIPESAGRGEEGTPIYFFVFDEWSYDRSVRDGSFLPELPHLRAFADHALFFTHARSPAAATHQSLPRILFQRRDDESLPYVFIDKKDPEEPEGPKPEHITAEPVLATRPGSILAMARRAGYTTYLVGFYLPYPHIVGSDADVCRAYSDYPKGISLPERMLLVTLGAPQYWFMPGIAGVWKKAWSHVFSDHWVSLNRRILDGLARAIATAPRRSLIFGHVPAPHAPFIFDGEGRYTGPFPVESSTTQDIDVDIMAGTPGDYHRGLLYLDHVVGEIVSDLKASGELDRALVVMTSDHSWRTDPDMPPAETHARKRHVPLLIKLPGQTEGRVMDDDIALDDLRPLLERAIRGTLDGAAVASFKP